MTDVEAALSPRLAGRFDPAFARVADTLAGMLASGEETGAAFTVLASGRPVVEIHGGVADAPTGRDWSPDTLACCFSVSKGILSILAHRLIDQGRLDLDAPVCRLWPEFAANGKAGITVADVLTHRAGLPAVSTPLAEGDLYDWFTMTDALARSAPVVPLDGRPVYHNMTYGYLLGEILRRATGRPVAGLVAEEVAAPLDADFGFALTDAGIRRAASMRQDDPESLFRSLQSEPDSLFSRSMAGFAAGEDFNSDRWRRATIGSGSGHATATGLARIFGVFGRGSAFLSPERKRAARTERARSAGEDPVLGVPIRLAEGLELSLPPAFDFGPSTDAVGHWGAGGAFAFADPQADLAVGFVTARMAPGMGSSQRSRRLVAALYDCL
jgi:CubicO group peptidase (beta-lactamase class C family)